MWVAVLIVVTTIHSSIVGARRRRRLVRSGSRVRGTIVDRREVHRRISGPDGDDTYDAYWVTCSFDPVDQVNLRQESRVSQAEWDSLPVGTEVEVAFDAADPTYNLMVFGDNK